MVAKPLDLEPHQRRAARFAHLLHDAAKPVMRGKRIATVDARDRQTVELGGRANGSRVEGAAARGRRDRPAIVVNQEQHGQVLAHRLGHRLQKLTFLRRAIANRANDDRSLGPVADLGGHAHGLQGVVAHRSDDAENVEGAIGEVRRHLPAARMRGVGAKQAVEELPQGETAMD
jgi:hypothetical protein